MKNKSQIISIVLIGLLMLDVSGDFLGVLEYMNMLYIIVFAMRGIVWIIMQTHIIDQHTVSHSLFKFGGILKELSYCIFLVVAIIDGF